MAPNLDACDMFGFVDTCTTLEEEYTYWNSPEATYIPADPTAFDCEKAIILDDLSASPPVKDESMQKLSHLHSKYWSELEFLRTQFTSLEAQLAPQVERAGDGGSQAKLDRLQYFISYVKDIMDQMEQALAGQYSYTMEQLASLEEDIVSRLLPVKHNLIEQMAACAVHSPTIIHCPPTRRPSSLSLEPSFQSVTSFDEQPSSDVGLDLHNMLDVVHEVTSDSSVGGDDFSLDDLDLHFTGLDDSSYRDSRTLSGLSTSSHDIDLASLDFTAVDTPDTAFTPAATPQLVTEPINPPTPSSPYNCCYQQPASCHAGCQVSDPSHQQPITPPTYKRPAEDAPGSPRPSRQRKRMRSLAPLLSQPRDVSYECSSCKEQYILQITCNPWWALYQQECPKCQKMQVPRVDIVNPINNVDFQTAILSSAAELGSDDEDACSECSECESDSEDEAGEAEGEEEPPRLNPDQAAKLLVLMCHARTCPGNHRNPQHAEVCKSTKFLMLHVRDCGGQLADGQPCPYTWCRPCKSLLHHLVCCPEPEACPICNPLDLPKPLQELRALNRAQAPHMAYKTPAPHRLLTATGH